MVGIPVKNPLAIKDVIIKERALGRAKRTSRSSYWGLWRIGRKVVDGREVEVYFRIDQGNRIRVYVWIPNQPHPNWYILNDNDVEVIE